MISLRQIFLKPKRWRLGGGKHLNKLFHVVLITCEALYGYIFNQQWHILGACLASQVPSLANGKVYYDETKERYEVGDELALSCDDEYILVGPNTTACQRDGSFSTYATCERGKDEFL